MFDFTVMKLGFVKSMNKLPDRNAFAWAIISEAAWSPKDAALVASNATTALTKCSIFLPIIKIVAFSARGAFDEGRGFQSP
ncbi:hypothetical protein PV773_15085 [Mesorhizobium sp. CC13]|uniref:hypothetical protein n=1 Tax=Mesorhizobium sp. CC13 TaxID=3029194 RepID=UPI0032653413